MCPLSCLILSRKPRWGKFCDKLGFCPFLGNLIACPTSFLWKNYKKKKKTTTKKQGTFAWFGVKWAFIVQYPLQVNGFGIWVRKTWATNVWAKYLSRVGVSSKDKKYFLTNQKFRWNHDFSQDKHSKHALQKIKCRKLGEVCSLVETPAATTINVFESWLESLYVSLSSENQVTDSTRDYLKKPIFDNWQWDDPEMMILLKQMYTDLHLTSRFEIEVRFSPRPTENNAAPEWKAWKILWSNCILLSPWCCRLQFFTTGCSRFTNTTMGSHFIISSTVSWWPKWWVVISCCGIGRRRVARRKKTKAAGLTCECWHFDS